MSVEFCWEKDGLSTAELVIPTVLHCEGEPCRTLVKAVFHSTGWKTGLRSRLGLV